VKIPFTGDRYESVHQAMLSLIDDVEHHEYHGKKLKTLLKKIPTEGRSVETFSTLLLY
jgi:hypothetical protein